MAEQQNQVKEEDLNQLLKVRRDKLAELQEAGKDPFKITKYDVTVHSSDIRKNYEEWERKGSFRSRTYDVQACDGKGFLL